VKQYKDSGADEARKETRTWLKARYTQAGIRDDQVKTEKWGERPFKDYIEYYVDVTVGSGKDMAIRQEQAVHFLWNVEKVSPKMRTIACKFIRTSPSTAPETDQFELRATFGYRVPKGLKD